MATDLPSPAAARLARLGQRVVRALTLQNLSFGCVEREPQDMFKIQHVKERPKNGVYLQATLVL